MPRIRTTKPEFWSSEQVFFCSRDARLLFIGLWNFCDDAGIIPASPLGLKAKVFPADELGKSEIKTWIGELIQNGLVVEYSVDNKTYWQVTGWKNHQKIDRPNYRYPASNACNPIDEHSTSTRRAIDDQSTTTRDHVDAHSTSERRSIDDRSPPEGKGMEGNGKEGNKKDIRKISNETSPVSSSENLDGAVTQSKCGVSSQVQEIFQYWQQVMEHPHSHLDDKRKRVIQAALKNYSIADLKKAIEGCSKTPFNMGDNDQNQRHDELTLILRDAAHIERFIGNDTHPPTPSQSKQGGDGYDDLMQGAI